MGDPGAGRRDGGTAVLLPGQGSQYPGMGRDLAEARPEVARLYERAEEVLTVPIRRICWEGPEEELTRTENAQPAILLHSFAVWHALPAAVRQDVRIAAGHSLGEFTAYLVADALEFEEALRLVRRRGELMAESEGGTMAAILGLADEEVGLLCERVEVGEVVPANFNSPGQIVISGEPEAVERAGELAWEAGARRVIPLKVSGAFHSPLMEVAREGLEEALSSVELGAPAFPVVANATAEPVTSAEDARCLLVRQLTAPVRWADGVRRIRREAPGRWLELGPGSVLTGLARRIDRELRVTPVAGPEELASLAESGDSRADAVEAGRGGRADG